MPVTPHIGLDVPPHGANVNTWDVSPINNNSQLLDNCFGSTTTKSITGVSGPLILTLAESRVNTLRFTGSLSANVFVQLGPIVKSWVVDNQTASNNFGISINGSSGAGRIVGIPPGVSQVFWDGFNMDYIGLGKIGEYWDYAGPAVPPWVFPLSSQPPYLVCDGTTFSSGIYPMLAAILGGTTLPDARGRTRFALNGGTGRLTASGGISGDVRFAAGGIGTGIVVAQANLTGFTLPHTISATDLGHIHPTQTGGNAGLNAIASSTSTAGPQYVNPTLANTLSGNANIQINGSVTSGGSSTPLASVPPGYVGGITLIRAG